MLKRIGFGVGLVVILFASTGLAQNKKISLTTLEWPPYVGENIQEFGASVKIVKEALKAVGYDLVVGFYPWARTVKLGKEDPRYAGYFPEYYSDEVAKEFYLSDPMPSGPLGFVERKTDPIVWETLDDLAKITMIGTVRDYINTAEFDDKAAKGIIKVEPVTDDVTNLLKVAAKRIPCAVIDKYVMQYLLDTEPRLKEVKNLLQFNRKIMEEKTLYICFKRNEEGKKLAALFNQGLKKIDVDKIMKEYMK